MRKTILIPILILVTVVGVGMNFYFHPDNEDPLAALQAALQEVKIANEGLNRVREIWIASENELKLARLRESEAVGNAVKQTELAAQTRLREIESKKNEELVRQHERRVKEIMDRYTSPACGRNSAQASTSASPSRANQSTGKPEMEKSAQRSCGS